MNLFKKVMRILGFTEIIKIPGKSNFDALEAYEVALMIEAFVNDDDNHFEPLAFNEFLHADLKNEKLQAIQKELNENAFYSATGEGWPSIDWRYLNSMSLKLKGEYSGD